MYTFSIVWPLSEVTDAEHRIHSYLGYIRQHEILTKPNSLDGFLGDLHKKNKKIISSRIEIITQITRIT